MRRGLTDRLTGVCLGVLIATALMCVASVSVASAQSSEDGPAPPSLPFISEDSGGPTAPADVVTPTSTPPEAPVPPEDPPSSPPVSPPSTTGGLKLVGSEVRWARRTLSVPVACEAAGTVTMLRNGRRIGRSHFVCPPSGVVRVRVRIAKSAARRLHGGARVRVKVRSGARRASKRMRIARAGQASSEAAVGRPLARASAFSCSDWYVASKTAFVWQTSSSWWEFYCFDQGFKGTHLADWWDLYYYTVYGYQQYYGTWTRYHADGCYYYWDPTAGSNWGPYC